MHSLPLTIVVSGDEGRLEEACSKQHIHSPVRLVDFYNPRCTSESVTALKALLDRPKDRVISLLDNKSIAVVIGKKDKINSSRQYKLLSRFLEQYRPELLIKQIGKGYVIYHYDHHVKD